MSLLDGDSLIDIFGAPVDEILALPDLLLADLDRGIDALTSGFQDRPITKRPVIHIPGWDDILHVVPEAFLPLEEQLARRRERAIRISESPTPESVRAIGSVLTWIDDVQDALVTASVLARLVGVVYKPAIPIAVGLGAAAEAINIFGAASAVATTPLTGKFRAQQAAKGFLGGQVGRALRTTTLRTALPTIGEAVQILQTTDQLFGVGLSLGPIVGLVEDLIFGLPQGADFAFSSGFSFRDPDEVFLRPEYQRAAENKTLFPHLATIARGAEAAAWLLATPDGVSFSDRVDAVVALNTTAELARGLLPRSNWQPLVLPALDRPRPSTRQIRPKTALDIIRAGGDPHATETYPLPQNPRLLSPRAQAAALLERAPTLLPAWLAQAPTKEARLFAEALATDIGFRTIRALEGCPCDFEIHNSPPWRVLVDSLELGLVPPAGFTQEQLREYFAAGELLYRQDITRPIPIRELRSMHQEIFRA